MSRRIDWFLVTDASKVHNIFFSVSSPKAIRSLKMSVILCQSIRHDVLRGFSLQLRGREEAKSRKRRRFITAHTKNTTAEKYTPTCYFLGASHWPRYLKRRFSFARLLEFVFKSRWRYRCMSLVKFMCSKVEVCTSG